MIKGVLSQATQAEPRIAEAQGLTAKYRFITHIDLKIDINDVIRNPNTNAFFRVAGLPERSSEPANSKFQVLPVELVPQEVVSSE